MLCSPSARYRHAQLFTHYIEQLDATMYAEGRKIVVLLDNASIHTLTTEGVTTEDMFGFRTCALGNRWWWRTGCLPHVWAMSLPHVGVGNGNNGGAGGGGANVADIGLDAEVDGVGLLIDHLRLGPSAMAAADFVNVDANQPTCAETGEDPLAREPASAATPAMWEAHAKMQAVYDDSNPASREAHRTARAACEMLIGYSRATCISPRDLCALFDICNPIIVARMERASPPLDLNHAPPPAVTHADTPPPETPRRRGRVLPAWAHVPTPDWVAQSARRQELIDAGAPAVMSGYLAAAEWMWL
ncbi:unnamed protein product [Closterium sp. NIES-64]|nr:unnamed protein product [Closterium sp. NIES-64]